MNYITGCRLASESPPTNGQADGLVASTANLDSIPLPPARSALHDLLDFLNNLNQAYVAVLQASRTSLGSKFRGGRRSCGTHPLLRIAINECQVYAPRVKLTLRGLLIGGQSVLEEWLSEERLIQGGEGEEDNLSATLERMGLLDEFDELVLKILDFLGRTWASLLSGEALRRTWI